MKKNFSNFLNRMAMFELGCDPGLSHICLLYTSDAADEL